MFSSVKTIKVNYDGDLMDYDGYEWDRDNVEYIISSVTRLDATLWKLSVYVTSENDMDSNAVIMAFDKEFRKPTRHILKITPAEYARLMDICLKHDLKLNIKSID